MNKFELTVGSQVFEVEPGIHQNMFTITSGRQSALIGKGGDGTWELQLQSGEAADLSAARIGAALEEYLSRKAT